MSVVVMLIYGGLLGLTGWQFVPAPIGFVPQQDKGYLILTVQLQDAASVERTERLLAYINRLILKDPNNQKPDPEEVPEKPKQAEKLEADAQAKEREAKSAEGTPEADRLNEQARTL